MLEESQSVLSLCRFTGNCIGKIYNLRVISIAVLIYIVLEVAFLENENKKIVSFCFVAKTYNFLEFYGKCIHLKYDY